MKTIWKFPLAVASRQRLEMPKGAKTLTVQMQKDLAVLWALVDENAETEMRVFDIYGTGESLPEIGELSRKYVGTFQYSEFVWHVFEIV